MSKKAFFKKLLVAGLCAVTATATVGFVACKKDKDDDNKKNEQVQEHKVTWDLDGGEWQTGKQGAAKVEDGAKLTKPDNPTKSGKEFDKWVLKADGTTVYDFDSAVKGDVALKAIWKDPAPSGGGGGGSTTPTDNEWSITWNLDGGTWPDGYTAPTKVTKGQKVTAPTTAQQPSQSGKTFKGWVDANGDAFDFDTAPTANTTIKATWDNVTNATYTIEYNMNGHGDPLPPTTDASSYDNDLESPAAVSGWKFGGWYLEAACTNKATGTISQSGTVYAKWTEVINYTNLMNRPTETIVYNNDFSTDVASLGAFSGNYGTVGVYAHNSKTVNGSVKIADGVAELVDPGDNCEVQMVTDFGLTVGVVEGYFEIQFASQKNSWTPVQFATTGGTEIFGIRIDSGKLKYRLGSSGTVTEPTGAPASANGTTYKIAFSFDSATKKFSMTINDVDYVTDVELASGDLGGVKFVSSNGGAAIVKIDNLVIVNPGELPAYKSGAVEKLDAAYAKYDLEKYTTNGASLTTAYTTAKSTIESSETTTRAAVISAYNTAISAMKEVKSDLALAREAAVQELSTYKNESDYTIERWAEVQDAIEAGTTAINEATSETDVTNALNAAKDVIDGIPDNNAAVWTVNLSDGTNACGTALTVVQGQPVTLAAIKEKVTVPSKKKIKGIYTAYSGGTYSGEITTNYTPTEDSTLYVEFDDISEYVVEFDSSKKISATDNYDVSDWVVSTAKTGVSVDLGDKEADGTTIKYVTTGVKLNNGGTLTFKLSEAADVTFYFWNTNNDDTGNTLKITPTNPAGEATTTSAGTAVAGSTTTRTYYVTVHLDANTTYTVERGGSKELALVRVVIG